MAENKLLPNHKDSENDALYTLMNILLQTENKQAQFNYIDLSLKTLGKSPVGRMLRDPVLFWTLIKLFHYDHFRSRDNTKAGLSMRNIVTWYPVIAGVSMVLHGYYLCLFHYQGMRHVAEQMSIILNFLAAPVAFQDVSDDVPSKDLPMAFYSEYKQLENEFQKPIPVEACQTLDKHFFEDWTDLYVKHFQSKEEGVPKIEYFATCEESERHEYDAELEDFWTKAIMSAEVNSEVLLKRVSTSHAADVVIKAMPAKLKALKHGLMELRYPNQLFCFYPISNKIFLYTLGEQLQRIKGAITEVGSQQ